MSLSPRLLLNTRYANKQQMVECCRPNSCWQLLLCSCHGSLYICCILIQKKEGRVILIPRNIQLFFLSMTKTFSESREKKDKSNLKDALFPTFSIYGEKKNHQRSFNDKEYIRYCCIAPQLSTAAEVPDEMLMLSWASSLRANARPGHTVEYTFCRSSKPRSWHSLRSYVRHTAENRSGRFTPATLARKNGTE